MGSVFLKFIAGAAAGLLTGLITEPLAPGLHDPAWGAWEMRTILLFGALVGAVIGGLDGLSKGGAVWIGRGLGMGLVLGAVGASFGSGLGASIANAILGANWPDGGMSPIAAARFTTQMTGRTLTFVGLGVFVGAAIGGASLNTRKLTQGATGGLVGGAIGGLLFDPIGQILAKTMLATRGVQAGEVGGPSRMVGWVVVASMVALMIGIVELVTRKAWLRADFGRNEFKEWPLDAAQNFIGRGETCHVILRHDPQIAPVHASIARQGRHFVVSDAGAPAGTFVNGHRIAQASLNPGDVVQLGGFALRFMVKGQQGAYMPHMQVPIMPPQPQGPPPGYGMPTQAMAPPQPMAPQPAPYQPMPSGQPTVAFGAVPVQGATLVAMDGPHAGRRFPVTGPLEIGREAAGIALMGDANASRRHASVSPAAGGLQVTDLGSTNGTFVDGQRVPSALARPGSLVRVGSTTFRVE